MIEQLDSNEPQVEFCLVGTGPVGLAVALELERLGHDVLVIEAGDREINPALSEASRAEIVDPARHASMDLAVCRALGGTSWTWGGRCVAYDEIDWMPRPFVADAHWPIGEEAIRPWFKSAASHLLCGTGAFTVPYGKKLTDGLTLDHIERWASESKLILAYRERLLNSRRIRISLRSTATGITLSPDGRRVETLVVHTPAGSRRVRAHNIVLAMGGVETTRLLLHVQQDLPHLFGGVGGPLGRYYMGHISGKIAKLVLDHPDDIRDLDFTLDYTGVYWRRRFMLTTEAQMEHKVLNTAFWADNPSFYDPGHRSGVLSMVWLALAFPPTGRRLLPEGVRLAHTGSKPFPYAAHIRNAFLGAPRGARDVYKILRDRFVKKPRKPGFLVSNRGGRYALHYHGEQAPNPESRIRAASEIDAFGVRRAIIDLRYTKQDVQSVIDSHKLLDKALCANGIGRLEFMYSDEVLHERVDSQASDGYHQVGSTRMGADPRASVVNTNLRVHGMDNLYVASSSVFPTAGQANSTYLAVAFGLRLANHLHAESQEAGGPLRATSCSA